MKPIALGAEAVIYKEKNKIIKERIKKNYRIKEIDSVLRKERTKNEARILQKLKRAGINVPEVLDTNLQKNILEIEFLEGEKVRDYLERTGDTKIFRQIANQVEKMHNAGIVHGDLTTSNIILQDKKIYLIDFGLSDHSARLEDKAVDLHLLKDCLKSKHFGIWEKAWRVFEQSYDCKDALKRLEIVERRGRYKERAPI